MTTSYNNIPQTSTDKTADYFNNYFNPAFDVSSDVDTAIISFFETMTANKESAKALASALIYTSLAQSMNPMEVLQQFTKLPKGQLNAYLAMMLNLNRIGTSLIGITNAPNTNKYVERMVLL